MESIKIKLKRIIYEGYIGLRFFNISIAFAKIRCILQNESSKSIQFKNKQILNYFCKQYKYLVEKYKKKSECEINTCNLKELPIWVFWWQGYDDLPNIIKTCQMYLQIHSNGHPVILLDKNNINDYIELPDYIWKQYEHGNLRIQHLADMIRVKLIKEYGGLWVDASILVNRTVPDYMFSFPIYTLKNTNDNFYNISNDKWTTFLIGGQKNNILCSFLDDLFMIYCKKNKPFIDYFMFDCMIAFARDNIPAVKDSLELVPECQGNYRLISEHLFECVNEELLGEINNNKSVFYKIPWNVVCDNLNSNSLFNYLDDKGKKYE